MKQGIYRHTDTQTHRHTDTQTHRHTDTRAMNTNLVTFARFYIGYLLFNVGGWVYFGYLLYYASFLKADTCNSYTKDFTDVAKIFLGVAMATTSLNIVGMTMDAVNSTERDIDNGRSLSMDHLLCMFIATFL